MTPRRDDVKKLSCGKLQKAAARSSWTFFKAQTQYLEYFQFKPYSFVKEVYQLKNDTLFNFDHCIASRILLRNAHQGNQVAKDILAAYPPSAYLTVNDKYIFESYRDSLNKEKLYNPALVHVAGYKYPSNSLKYFKMIFNFSSQYFQMLINFSGQYF